MITNEDLFEKRWINEIKGFGVFALQNFKVGQPVVKDEGKFITKEVYLLSNDRYKNVSYQVDDNKLLVPFNLITPSVEWFVNHSCDPNTGYLEPYTWIALRDIKVGEELTHDYAVLWTSDIEFYEINPCLCGSSNCRGKMTSDDWMLKSVQNKYSSGFPAFLQRRINLGNVYQG